MGNKKKCTFGKHLFEYLRHGVRMNSSVVVADTSDYEGAVRLSVANWALLMVYIGLWKDS